MPKPMKSTLLLFAVMQLSFGQVPVDLCELLKGMERWDGQVVRVTGILKLSGPIDGSDRLAPQSCDAQVRVKGYTFPNDLALNLNPQSKTALHKVDYEWDERSRRRYSGAINRIDRDRQYIQLTVVGLFETRIPMTLLVNNKGTLLGFGHMGASPGQILIRTIEEIVVVERDGPK
jgi:hypothetical protein